MDNLDFSEHFDVVESYTSSCRICLTDSADQYISVYDDILNVKIVDLLQEISNISICLSSELLSYMICTSCCKNLQNAIRTRRKFLRSETFLLQTINNKDVTLVDLNNDPFLQNDVDIEFVDLPEVEEHEVIEDDKSDVEEDISKSWTLAEMVEKSAEDNKVQSSMEWIEVVATDVVQKPNLRAVKKVLSVDIDKVAVLSVPASSLKFSCCMCPHLSDSEEQLIEHLHTHPERTRRSEFRKKILEAMPNHRQEGRKTCIKCMRPFLLRNFDMHLKAFYVEPKFECKICELKFGFYDKMKQHERRCKMGKKEEEADLYECGICQKLTKTKLGLEQHVKLHALTEEERNKFICQICGNGYPTMRMLKGHVHQHSQIATHACTMCNKIFKTATNLRAHIRVHNNDRIFKCQYCENTYIHLTDKKRHEMSIHTGERPHQCKECGKGFVKKYSLTAHMRQSHE